MQPVKYNGTYKIIEFETYKRKESTDYHVVLAKSTITGNWVTWECIDTDYFFWGHYFTNELSARIDFHVRLTENYKILLDEKKHEEE